MKTPQHMKEDTDDSEPADERDIQTEYSSDYLFSPSTREGTKTLPARTYINISTITQNIH